MTFVVDDLLRALERQAGEGAIDETLANEIERVAPPSAIAAPRLLAALERTSRVGRFAIGSIALRLADDPGYRSVVEAVMDGSGLNLFYWVSLVSRYEHLQTDDALGWLFDLLLKEAADHGLAMTVIDDRFESLLRSRPDAVLRFVFDPTRDPGPAAIDAGLAGVQAGAPVEALEHQWEGWVRAGEFDGGIWPLPGGCSSGSALVSALVQLAPLHWSTPPEFVAVRERLTDAAVLRWNALLASDDPTDQKRGLTTLAGLLLKRQTCFGRYPGTLPTTLPCKPRLQHALVDGFHAAARLERGGDPEVERHTIDLGWDELASRLEGGSWRASAGP